MANRIVTAQIQGEYINLSSRTAGAAGSHNAVSLEISFDTSWDGTSRKVYFISADGTQNACVLLTLDLRKEGETDVYVLPMPSEGLASAGEMTLTVKGYHIPDGGTTADRIMMSASTHMTVLKSDLPSTDNQPVDVTPTQAEQLQGEVDGIKSQIGGAAEAAAAAKASSDAAALSATAASASATAASNSAAAAAASESASGTNATAAASSAQAAATAKAAAESAQLAAETAKAAAEAAQSAAQTAKTAAETAQGKAESAETNAEAAKTAAQSAQSLAEAAKTAAQGAATAAQAAQAAAETAKSGAETAAANAGASADESEAWASGTIGGVAVPSNHPAYHNNSKYYKDQAQAIVGGDYPTKTEAQGYVDTHNAAADAHADLFAAKLGTTGNGSNVTAAFTEAAERENISTGEKLSGLFGKVMKWFSSLGSAAFTDATAYDAAGTASGAVSTHNSAIGAHNDLFAAKQSKINASGILKGTGDGGVSAADAAALKTLLDTLTSVTPATGDKIPLTDISGAVAGYSTIANILALATPGAQIATGSYTGTGTYGSANPCSLTFNFSPRLLMLFSSLGIPLTYYNSVASVYAFGATDGLTTTFVQSALWQAYYSDGGASYAKKSSDGKTISWYQASMPLFNVSGTVYRYIAIG